MSITKAQSWRLSSAIRVLSVAAAAILAVLPAHAATVTEAFSPYAAGSAKTVDHAVWDGLLKAHIKPDATGLNRFDYAGLKARGQDRLKAYITALQAVDVAKLDRPEQFAFWSNLYNAKTIDVVLDHYPVASIRNISINEGLLGFFKKSAGFGGPWKAKILIVAGQKLSLDDIEHNILRPVFKDPRVHYAVNCASMGCPNLSDVAFTGANLEKQLDAGARAFVNHPRGIAVVDGKVTASSIYTWFQVDFGGSDAGVLAHVRKFAAPELSEKLKTVTSIGTYQYDWALNDIATK